MSVTAVNEPTSERLLQSAVEVFAERGFRDATVREICAKAGVNVASINYYYRSKQALYAKALAFAFETANRRYPQDTAADKTLPAEQRLGFFVANFLNKLLDDSHLGFHGKLIAREIADPTEALDQIAATAIYPQFVLLEDIVRSIAGPDLDQACIRRCVLSVAGQCLMFKHSRSVIDRLFAELIATPREIELSAEHIAQFSLAAICRLAALAQEKQ
jgi:AcrR family transcriptional regulator